MPGSRPAIEPPSEVLDLVKKLSGAIDEAEKAVQQLRDLRVAILKALRAATIEIPFNQVDVDMRDLDGVKRPLLRMVEENAAERERPGNGQKDPAGALG